MAAKDSSELFAQSSTRRVSASTIVAFLISAVLFFGGMVVFSYAFNDVLSDLENSLLAVGGLAATFFATWIAFGILPAMERRGEKASSGTASS